MSGNKSQDILMKIERDIRVMARTRHVKGVDENGKECWMMHGIKQSELLKIEARIFAMRGGVPKMIENTG